MKTWHTKKLGSPEVCTIIMGQSPPSSSYNTSGNGLPFYQGKKDFGKIYPKPSVWCNAPAKIAEENDVLISVRAPVGPVNFCKEKTAIGRGLAVLRANKKKLDYWYLFLFLNSIEDKWNVPSGAVFSAITKTDLENLEIPLPPIEIQKKIVEKIEGLFAKIDEAAQLRAESSAASAALLPSALHHIFSRAEKEGWEVINIGEVVKLQGGFAFKSREYEKTGVPIVRIQNLQNETIDISDAPCMPSSRKNEFADYLLKDSDILVAMSGATTGKIAMVRKENTPALLNQRVGRFLIKYHLRISNDFLFWVVRIIQQKIFERAYGAAQPNISGKNIEEIKIPLPPIPEQQKIVAYLDSLSQKSRALQALQKQTADDLSAMKQSVLHQAFSKI